MDVRSQQCDRCPAHAHVRITFGSGYSLYMCRHHERAYFPEDAAYEGILFEYEPVTL